MSNLTPGDGVRDVNVKDSGNNDNSGANILRQVGSLPVAADRAQALTPPPALFTPASIVDSGASRYSLSETFTFPDNVQGALQFSSVAADFAGFTGSTLINAAENAQATLLTITTNGDDGMTAYSSNGKSRTAFDARFIGLNGPNQIGASIDGATDQAFLSMGQVLARFSGSVCVDVTSTGESPRYFQFNEINANADNCIGLRYNTPSTGAAAFRIGALTYEEDPTNPDTGAGCIGLKVEKGTLVGYAAEMIMEKTIVVDVDGDLIIDKLLSIGDVEVFGVLDMTCRRMTGDLVVNGGASATVQINNHAGNVLNAGILNGMINGVNYGTWNQGNDYLATFFRGGFILSSYEDFGFITLDGSTDTVDNIVASYDQAISSSRTIDFQLIDANTLTVYYNGSNTDATAGHKTFSGFNLVNPLPVSPVNLSLQIKDNGSQVSNAGANLYFTRLP